MNVFNDGVDCNEVDFLIMIHPRSQPSSYQLSDFTLKGERKATMSIDPSTDYVFQVIAREDKGSEHGIDYKYSDMVTSYTNGTSSASNSRSAPVSAGATSTPSPPYELKDELNPPKLGQSSELSPLHYDDYDIEGAIESEDYDEKSPLPSNPWYIYECIPFIKVGFSVHNNFAT